LIERLYGEAQAEAVRVAVGSRSLLRQTLDGFN
jgi:hypothetical protein